MANFADNPKDWLPARYIASTDRWMLPGDELALTLDEDLYSIGPRLDPPTD